MFFLKCLIIDHKNNHCFSLLSLLIFVTIKSFVASLLRIYRPPTIANVSRAACENCRNTSDSAWKFSQSTAANGNNSTVYAVISCDKNPAYLFSLPVVVLSWKRIRVKTIVVLTGTKRDYSEKKSLEFLVEALEVLADAVIFVCSCKMDSFTLAQTSRLFLACFRMCVLSHSSRVIMSFTIEMYRHKTQDLEFFSRFS